MENSDRNRDLQFEKIGIRINLGFREFCSSCVYSIQADHFMRTIDAVLQYSSWRYVMVKIYCPFPRTIDSILVEVPNHVGLPKWRKAKSDGRSI